MGKNPRIALLLLWLVGLHFVVVEMPNQETITYSQQQKAVLFM